jgi:hypothetical protein
MSTANSQAIPYTSGTQYLTLTDPNQAAPFESTPRMFVNGEVVLSISGPTTAATGSEAATAITATVYRSATDPNSPLGASWVAADAQITGNPSTGVFTVNGNTVLGPIGYAEYTFGFWKVAVTVISGGVVTTSISGATI